MNATFINALLADIEAIIDGRDFCYWSPATLAWQDWYAAVAEGVWP